MTKRVTIGIDPGVNTGICVLPSDGPLYSMTIKIHQAMKIVSDLIDMGYLIRINIEDPHNWRGKNAQARKQGAGSVKRDFTIWRDFANDHPEIQFVGYSPKAVPDMTHNQVCQYYKITKKHTNAHERDAIILAHKRFPLII